MTEEIGIYGAVVGSYRAVRREKPFKCKIDGMTLAGNMFDWEIRRPDGATFPLPDHLFKIIFEPLDDHSRKIFDKTYTVRPQITESVKVSDLVEAIGFKINEKS